MFLSMSNFSGSFFFDELDKFDARIALLDGVENITYRQLLHLSDSLKNVLSKRTLVFLSCRNSIASVIGYIAALRARCVPVLLSDRIQKEYFFRLLFAYRPKYIWLPDSNDCPHGFHRLSVGLHGYQLLVSDEVASYPIAEELALLMTTSGSTGSPVFVRQSYENLHANTAAICDILNIQPSDRPVTTLPMHYTYGLSVLNTHLSQGCSIVLNEASLMEKSFWALMKNAAVTSFAGVPYTYEMLDRLRFERMTLPSLRVMTQAGGALHIDLVKKFALLCRDRNIRFYCMYGQVEATARMAVLPCDAVLTKAGSIGLAIPGGSFWLEDEEGHCIESAHVKGELCYSGANVSLGTAASVDDLNLPDLNLGHLRTGDMAYRDEDGFYFIVGRKKRFVKIFGNRINLADIDALLGSLGYECATVGNDNQIQIYTTALAHEHRQMLINVAEHLAIHNSVFQVIHINAIPRNESGKILYAELSTDRS